VRDSLQKTSGGCRIVLVHTAEEMRRTLARRSLEHEADQYTDPWWREAVIYQIYPL
jgi:hypothetical protein